MKIETKQQLEALHQQALDDLSDERIQRDKDTIQRALVEIALRSKPPSSWEDMALCSSDLVDPEIFAPYSSDMEALDRAKRFCGSCAVQASCLEYALQEKPDGNLVWGGLSDAERRAKRRSQRAQAGQERQARRARRANQS